jgi:CheY-like chemotaxis protein
VGFSDRHSEFRLLIVEDEALVAMELEDILGDLGYEVLAVCGSVDRALSTIDDLYGRLNGAIIDANLGGTSALPVAEALETRQVPFVIASGYSGDEIRRLGFHCPRIGKPYRREEIQQAVGAMVDGG